MIELERSDDVFLMIWSDGGDNRFNAASVTALNAALDEVEGADGPRSLVTTGAGKFFTNGLDLEWMSSDCDDIEAFVATVVGLLGRLVTFPVVTVAAVNGHAFAGGAMFAMAHDHRVMREDRGYWCTPEVELGMRFAPGMNELLKAKLPGPTAHEAMTLGLRYGGPDALAAGIVNAIAPQDLVLDDAIAHAAAYATRAGPVLGAIKRDLYAQVLTAAEQGGQSRPTVGS